MQRKLTLVGIVSLVVALSVFAIPVSAATPTTATFSGAATIHIVMVNGGQMTVTGVPFSVIATAGGAGIGSLFLTITLGPNNPLGLPSSMTVGGTVASGLIVITSSSASGGGTIAPPEASQDGFGVTTNGGQFQCQNAGFSALLGMGIRQMDVHGAVPSGSLATS